MPLTEKGESILKAMQQEYGSKRGEQVFYASRNAGTISGVDAPISGVPQTTGSAAGAQLPPTPFGGNSAYGNSLLNGEKK